MIEEEENQVVVNYDEDFDDDNDGINDSSNGVQDREMHKSKSNHLANVNRNEEEEGAISEQKKTSSRENLAADLYSSSEKKESDMKDLKSNDNRGYSNMKPPANSFNTSRDPPNSSFNRPASGLYIPPRKRQQLLAQKERENAGIENMQTLDNPGSITRQRETWETLKKDIHGTINRINISTLKPLLSSLFEKANLIRGRGILARTLLKASITSPSFAHIYAGFIAVINTKLPEIGELLLARSILAFRRHYRRKEKRNATSVCILIGHLINQTLAHELLGLQILAVLLDGDPTNDSVEIAISLTKTIGKHLSEVSPSGLHAILERFRALLQEGSLSHRIQYQLEQLFQIRKKQWEGYPIMLEELDLVEKEDQITFEMGLDEELNKEEILDVFREDLEFLENEKVWKQIQNEILGNNDDSDGGGDSSTDSGSGESDTGSESDSEDDSEDDAEEGPNASALVPIQTQTIQDLSESDLINLRRTIYLTIMSSATFEECAHKLAKTNIPLGRESELINMLIECCSQERTFLRYYAMVSARFCLLDRRWKFAFEDALKSQYSTIHRLETNKLRNVAKLFAHLFHTHSFSWENLSVIHLNEEETTSSSRIFIKILLQEMAEAMGMHKLKLELEKSSLDGMFPMDVEKPRDTRFAINFFTSIGLGPLTDGLREFLKNAPKLILAKAEADRKKQEEEEDDGSTSSSELSSSSGSMTSSDSSSYYSSSSSSYSSYSRKKKRRRKKGNRRSYKDSRSDSNSSTGSYSDSLSRSYSRDRSRSRSSKPEPKRSSKSKYRPKKDSSGIPKEIIEKDTDKNKSISKPKKQTRSYSRSVSSSPASRKKEKTSSRESNDDSRSKSRKPKTKGQTRSRSPDRESRKDSRRVSSRSFSRSSSRSSSSPRQRQSNSKRTSNTHNGNESSTRRYSPSRTSSNKSRDAKRSPRSSRDRSYSRSRSSSSEYSQPRSRKYSRARLPDEKSDHKNTDIKRKREEKRLSKGRPTERERDTKRRKERSYSK